MVCMRMARVFFSISFMAARSELYDMTRVGPLEEAEPSAPPVSELRLLASLCLDPRFDRPLVELSRDVAAP